MALRQAESRGVPVVDELAMLAIHGALHVAGFDDETDADRQQMVQRMNQRAAEVGIASDSEWWSHHYNWEVAACA
jgi:rRNA maturation RNase YbeY